MNGKVKQLVIKDHTCNLPATFKKVLEHFESILDSIPSYHRDKTEIEIEEDLEPTGYMSCMYKIYYWRDETLEEIKVREKKRQDFIEQCAIDERELYESLKKKFEGTDDSK